MRLHKIEIQLYADNEEQAAQAAAAMNGFVSQMLGNGRVVTAPKIVEAMSKLPDNVLVKNRIETFFPKLKKS